MVLSKPLYSFLGFYFSQLHNNPIRTRAISSGIIATAGNLASQYIASGKVTSQSSLIAFGLYGLLFGGTIPHYFYNWLEKVIDEEASYVVIKKLLVERLIYSPLYIGFTLYMISRLEGKTHNSSAKQLAAVYWPILSASWKYLTVIQFLNLQLVPPMLRVLIVNFIGFFWVVYIAHMRRQKQVKEK